MITPDKKCPKCGEVTFDTDLQFCRSCSYDASFFPVGTMSGPANDDDYDPFWDDDDDDTDDDDDDWDDDGTDDDLDDYDDYDDD